MSVAERMRAVKVFAAAAINILLFASCGDGGGGSAPHNGIDASEAQYIDIPDDAVGKRAYMAAYNLKHGQSIYGDDVGGAILMDSNGNTKATWALDFKRRTAGGMAGARRICSMSPAFDRCREEAYRLANRSGGNANGRVLARTNNNGPLDSSHSLNDTLAIKVDTTAAYEYEEKDFTLAAIGTHCDVWAAKDKDTGALPSGYKTGDTPSATISFSDIAAALDKAYEAETNLFGTAVFNANALAIGGHIATSDKLHIIMYNMKDTLCGFFYPVDFYADSVVDGSIHSNAAQCIYVNYNLQKDTMYATVVHEFQHLLREVSIENNDPSDAAATWYNEMLSTVSEDVLKEAIGAAAVSAQVDYLPAFIESSARGFLNWQGEMGNYGVAYVFGVYLARKYGASNPIEFIHTLAACKKLNEEAVEYAISASGGSAETFDDALCDLAQYTILRSPLPDVSGAVGGKSYTLHGMQISHTVWQNSATMIDRPDMLYDGGFYVADLGRVAAGDKVLALPVPSYVKTFLVYR